jgi:hypothetical protein
MGPLGDALRGVGDFIVQHKGPVEKDRKMLVPAGRAIMEGLVESIQDGIPLLDGAIAKVNSAMSVNGSIGVPTYGTANGFAGTQDRQGGISVYVTVESRDDDPEELGRRIGDSVAYELRMKGAMA